MSRYAGTNQLGTYLSSNGLLGTLENGLLQDCLNRAESVIDDYTRRNFLGTAGTAYYNRFTQGQMAGQAFYLNQDLFSLTSLTLGDGRGVPVGSVWLEPRNAGPPYRVLRLKSSYVYTWNTDSDMSIAGTWGYGTVVPDSIVAATIEYAAYLYRLKDVGPGGQDVAGFPEGGEVQYPKGMPEHIKWKLTPYRSRSGGVI